MQHPAWLHYVLLLSAGEHTLTPLEIIAGYATATRPARQDSLFHIFTRL